MYYRTWVDEHDVAAKLCRKIGAHHESSDTTQFKSILNEATHAKNGYHILWA